MAVRGPPGWHVTFLFVLKDWNKKKLNAGWERNQLNAKNNACNTVKLSA